MIRNLGEHLPVALAAAVIKATHEWIVDGGQTPQILVNAEAKGVAVPLNYVENGQIVLNIHPAAVQDLIIDENWVAFSARFSSSSFRVEIPIPAIMAIYNREQGIGMLVDLNEELTLPPMEQSDPARDNTQEGSSKPPKRPRGGLKIVK